MLYQQHLKKNRISHNNSFCFAKLNLEQVLKRIGNILRAMLKVFCQACIAPALQYHYRGVVEANW